MKRALVTGGTGFLGANLISQLVAQSWQVTATYRTSHNHPLLQGLPIHWVQAHLTDADALLRAMPDEEFTVFHAASDTSQWHKHHHRQTQTNVQGTQNMLLAAQRKPVRRFVYTSSISAFGKVHGLITEKTPSNAPATPHNYSQTKYRAQQLVLEATRQNRVSGIVLNPCHIIGPWDTNNWIQLFKAVRDNNVPGVPPSSGNFAFVTEVAKAHIAAAENGRTGEMYLLGGPHHSFLELIREIERQTDKPRTRKASPKIVLQLAERAMRLASALSGKEPQLTPDKLYALTHPLQANDTKARQELGYSHKTLQELVSETLAWLNKHP